jgi:hypothetical protein
MNERIEKLAKEHGLIHDYMSIGERNDALKKFERFAELIVRECIKQAHSVADLRGVNDDMVFGADTAAVRIHRHFGFEQTLWI